MPDRKYQKLAYLVELIVPEDFSVEQTQIDLKNSVQFGRPIITFRSQIKNWREPVKSTPDNDVNGTITKE